MSRMFKTVLVVLFGGVTLWHVAGCQSMQQTEDLFAALQQGKARGHLTVTTSGAVSAGTQTELFLGLRGTSMSFDGNINFGEAEFERLEVGRSEGQESEGRKPEGRKSEGQKSEGRNPGG